MAYCTQADLIERYGARFLVQLTDRGEIATDTIDGDVVDRAISEADALIDGYLKGRYVLPLDPVPDPVGTLSRQIAIYTLHVYDPEPKILRDYEDAIQTLIKISKGTVQLDADGVAPATTGAGGAQVTDRERPFTAANMKGLI